MLPNDPYLTRAITHLKKYLLESKLKRTRIAFIHKDVVMYSLFEGKSDKKVSELTGYPVFRVKEITKKSRILLDKAVDRILEKAKASDNLNVEYLVELSNPKLKVNLKTHVFDMDLSYRTKRVLWHLNISTLAQIVITPLSTIKAVRGANEATIMDLKREAKRLGVNLE